MARAWLVGQDVALVLVARRARLTPVRVAALLGLAGRPAKFGAKLEEERVVVRFVPVVDYEA